METATARTTAAPLPAVRRLLAMPLYTNAFYLWGNMLVVALAALVGPLYCGYLCPAGALQELLGHLGLARRMPQEIDRRARFAKYALLAALVVGSLAFGSDSVLHLDLLREGTELEAE